MPTYDYKCENCGQIFEKDLKIADRKIPTESPCVEQILHDENPTGQGFEACGGKITQIVVAPYFGYDNIKTKHSKKEPGWFREKMQEMKVKVPGNNL